MLKIEIEINRGITTRVTRRDETYSVSQFEYVISSSDMPIVIDGRGSWGEIVLRIISDIGRILSQRSLFEDTPKLIEDN